MTAVIEVTGTYQDTLARCEAVKDVSFAVQENTICGLLGRNGAGKTTLMRLITGQEFASAGEIRVFGENPVENASVLSRTCFVRESQVYPENFRGKPRAARGCSACSPTGTRSTRPSSRPNSTCRSSRRIKKMSRGQRSAVGAIIGLAARAELTFFDEPYAGLDAVARELFYSHLLEDYSNHPRTIVLSTHLIDEAAKLLEHVIVIDGGTVLMDADADDLRGTAVTLVGGQVGRGRLCRRPGRARLECDRRPSRRSRSPA